MRRLLNGLLLLTLAAPSLAQAATCCHTPERQARAAVLESACCCPVRSCEAAPADRAQLRAVMLSRSDDGAASLCAMAGAGRSPVSAMRARAWSLHAPPLPPFLTHHTFLIPLRR